MIATIRTGNPFHAEDAETREKIAEKRDRKILRDLLSTSPRPPRETPFKPWASP
jgi:hypothetical protein